MSIRQSIAALNLGVALTLSTAPANAADVLQTGTFVGAGGHKASGNVSIVMDGDVMKVVFAEDFVLQQAPAPQLRVGQGRYTKGTIFATLAKFKGVQEYTISAGTDLGQFNEFWIWCEKFNVPLAVAKLR